MAFNKKIAQDEARRCPQCAEATCLAGCPLGIDIPGFIRLLREGDTAGALDRIKEQNPFASICGRICPAPCERACIFYADGQPIPIRELECYAADNGSSKLKTASVPQKEKVAVIGTGPGGMSAAYYLAFQNFQVTVFEALHGPGGTLRYAIPDFRLSQKVLDEQFDLLNSLKVEIKTDKVFGPSLRVDEIFMKGYKALLLATGASVPVMRDIRGIGFSGVYYDHEFLCRLQSIGKDGVVAQARRQKMPGLKTVVIGRGPAAFDTARMSARLGSQVSIIIDGFEEETGVSDDMRKEAQQEGVKILSLRLMGIVGNDNGFVRGVECQNMEIIEGQGGLKLEVSKEAPFILEADTVIIANGHKPNNLLRHYLPQLKHDDKGLLWTDGKTGMTSMERVFACGSLINPDSSVAQAIASGKMAAKKIIQYLDHEKN
ncbi:MAG: FAD-dependent oxidoreductase [Candidatus Omnitrophica bacterium]|nr:FAD-dependent oxidoreductase [Candidatus Omnitrophota bacterium]